MVNSRCSRSIRTNCLSKWEGSTPAKERIQTQQENTVLTEQLTQKVCIPHARKMQALICELVKDTGWGVDVFNWSCSDATLQVWRKITFSSSPRFSCMAKVKAPLQLCSSGIKLAGPKVSWSRGCYSQKHLS